MTVKDRLAYAKGLLNIADWKHTVTIRPVYKLNESSSYNLVQRLARKLKSIIFYTMEQDTESPHRHLHLLIDKNVSKKQVVKALNIKNDSVTYSEPINSKSDIASYITKNLNNNNSYHDICLDK